MPMHTNAPIELLPSFPVTHWNRKITPSHGTQLYVNDTSLALLPQLDRTLKHSGGGTVVVVATVVGVVVVVVVVGVVVATVVLAHGMQLRNASVVNPGSVPGGTHTPAAPTTSVSRCNSLRVTSSRMHVP